MGGSRAEGLSSGLKGGGVVESVGEGVTSVKVGDHVIPLYTAGKFRHTTAYSLY